MPSDNDADKRPRMYARAASQEGEVEVTVKGGEGESSDDIEGKFERAIDRMLDAQEDLPDEDDAPNEGVQ